MPRHARKIVLPKHHPIHGVADENAERVLIQAANDNAVYEQEATLAAKTIDLMRSGVNENVARLLAWKMAVPVHKTGDLPVARMIREERVNSELYRSVQGQELSNDTHYRNSTNVAHMNSSGGKKALNHLENLGRAAGTVVGMNNYVEAQLENRFGTQEELFRARNHFLANQLLPVLTTYHANPALWAHFTHYFHVNTPNAVCNRLGNMSQIDLRRFATWLDGVNGADVLRADLVLERLYHPINEDKALGRRLNLALKLAEPLISLSVSDRRAISNYLRMPPIIATSSLPIMIASNLPERIAGLTLSELNNPVFAPLVGDAVFNDLKLLVGAEQSADAKLAVAEVVNDHQPLRQFWETKRKIVGDEGEMIKEVEDMLELNNLYELEKNPEAKALLQVLRTKVNDPNMGAAQLRTVLKEIKDNELPNAERDEATKNKIEQARQEFQNMRNETQDQLTSLIALRKGYSDADLIAKTKRGNLSLVEKARETQMIERKAVLLAQYTKIDGHITNAVTGHMKNIDVNGLLKRQVDIKTEIDALDKDISDLSINHAGASCMAPDLAKVVDLEKERDKRKDELEEAQKKARDVVVKLRGCGARRIVGSQYDVRLQPLMTFLETADFLNIIAGNPVDAGLVNQEKTARDDFDHLYKEIVEVKTTPFVLLQRLLRRDYYAQRKLPLDNTVFNEEANEYALMQALLMVEQASDEHANLLRSGNDKAAVYMRRPAILKGWDTFARGVNSAQNSLGLEMINMENLSAESFLEQVVGLDSGFAAFRGINKYMTPRDVRDLMNKSGQKMSPETVERFARILEEGIGKFQKVSPHLRKGIQSGDWDMENLIIVLKKIRTELWVKNFLTEVKAKGTEGEREKILINMMSGARLKDKKVSAEIVAEIQHSDAVWRKVLVKNELKQILCETDLLSANKIKSAGIDFKKKRIAKLKSEVEGGTLSDQAKARKQKEMENLQAEVDLVTKQIEDSKDLYDRVEEAREYIRENDLNRKQKKQYLQEMGLTQVFDKMGTNFRMQRAWHHTKRGVKWTGGKIKAGWAWSRKNVINMEKAGKAFSIGRVVATPVTWPLGKAWKWGTFPFRLAGRAVSRGTHMPKRLAGVFSDSMMRSYLRDRIIDLSEDIAEISTKQAKLQSKVEKAHYGWDKKRLNGRINKLEEEKQDLVENLEEYKKIAVERKINLGAFSANKE